MNQDKRNKLEEYIWYKEYLPEYLMVVLEPLPVACCIEPIEQTSCTSMNVDVYKPTGRRYKNDWEYRYSYTRKQ